MGRAYRRVQRRRLGGRAGGHRRHGPRDQDVRLAWAGRHLLYVQDVGGDENWRLYDVLPGHRGAQDLTAVREDPRADHRVEQAAPDRGARRDERGQPAVATPAVARLDLETGNLVKEIENPGYWPWARRRGPRGALRARAAARRVPGRAGPGFGVGGLADAADHRRGRGAGDVVVRAETAGPPPTISAAGADTGRLTRVDLATGATTVLAEDPEGGRRRAGPATPATRKSSSFSRTG